MGYLDAQCVPVVRVLEVTRVYPPVKDDPVLIGNREKFLQVARLAHEPIGVIAHDVLDLTAPARGYQFIPSWPFPVPSPCRRAVIDIDVPALDDKP